MKMLWITVAVLGCVYVAVWAAVKNDHVVIPSPQATAPGAADSNSERLSGIAKGDAISRVPNTAEITVASIKPAAFTGSDLQSARSIGSNTTAGFEIILVASLNHKPVSKLTYHAAPPDKVIFVKQEEVK